MTDIYIVEDDLCGITFSFSNEEAAQDFVSRTSSERFMYLNSQALFDTADEAAQMHGLELTLAPHSLDEFNYIKTLADQIAETMGTKKAEEMRAAVERYAKEFAGQPSKLNQGEMTELIQAKDRTR